MRVVTVCIVIEYIPCAVEYSGAVFNFVIHLIAMSPLVSALISSKVKGTSHYTRWYN